MVEILRYLVSHTYYTLVNRAILKVCGVFIHTGGGSVLVPNFCYILGFPIGFAA